MINVKKEEIPVIVSLTSIPSRLSTLHLTIRSLLNQDKRPKKIILWLHHSLKKEIPKNLAALENDLFEIMYSDLICSHRKLIHSLTLFPTMNLFLGRPLTLPSRTMAIPRGRDLIFKREVSNVDCCASLWITNLKELTIGAAAICS